MRIQKGFCLCCGDFIDKKQGNMMICRKAKCGYTYRNLPEKTIEYLERWLNAIDEEYEDIQLLENGNIIEYEYLNICEKYSDSRFDSVFYQTARENYYELSKLKIHLDKFIFAKERYGDDIDEEDYKNTNDIIEEIKKDYYEYIRLNYVLEKEIYDCGNKRDGFYTIESEAYSFPYLCKIYIKPDFSEKKQKIKPTPNKNRIILNKDSKQKTYIMLDKHTGLYKIGKSVNPSFRERTLLSQAPLIELIAVHKQCIEKELHNKYEDKKIRGEWFELEKEEVSHIINHYNFAINKKG